MISLTYGIYSEKQRVKWWLLGAGGWGKWENIGQRAQTFSYKMNNFWEYNVCHGDYS